MMYKLYSWQSSLFNNSSVRLLSTNGFFCLGIKHQALMSKHTCILLLLHAFSMCMRVCVCRCQTDPCVECEYQGQSHAVGDRWRSDHCQLCYCLANLTVQCSPYCPYAVSGCPQVRIRILCAFVSHVHLRIYVNILTVSAACVCLHVLWKYNLVH